MKANQFAKSDEAVSPVIGVILMVAITVVLAAVVFVLVSNLSKSQDKGEDAAATISSPATGQIYITLIRGGANAPYASSDMTISVDGTTCVGNGATNGATLQDTISTGTSQGRWDAGETYRISSGCLTPTTSGSSHLVTVIVHGTIIKDNENVVLK